MNKNKFFQNSDVTTVARQLLGQLLTFNSGSHICSGMIVEVEAYRGIDDRACHAYGGKRTARTEVMYKEGGRTYVYLCYGIHHLLNIVTNRSGHADAVLIRALEPVEGLNHMKHRTKENQWPTRGPGKLTKALGIDMNDNDMVLGDKLNITKYRPVHLDEIISTTRIGVGYAGEDAMLPWRYYIKNNPWVSRQ